MNQAAVLKAGNYFAGFSVLTEGNTSASAITHEDCEILSLAGTAFIQILRKHQAVAKNLAVGLGKMVSQFVDSHSYITYFNEDAIEVDNEMLTHLPMAQWRRLKTIPLNLKGNILCLASIAPYDQELKHFCNRAHNLNYEIHLINDDDFKIQLDSLTKNYQKLRSIGASKTKLMPEKLNEQDEKLLKQTILNSNSLFSATSKEVKDQLLNYLGISNILPGQLILTPNIKVDSFHILVSGEVSIFQEIEETVMLAKVASIKVNESFGLVPLLLNEDNSLTAIATSVGSIVSIPKKVFTQLMGHAYFSIEVARNMAGLIQSANKHSGLENYDKKRLPDFKNISISIPLDIITRFQVLPLEQADKKLTLGLVNPDGHLLYSTIGRYLVNLKVNVFILTEEQFHNFLPLYK